MSKRHSIYMSLALMLQGLELPSLEREEGQTLVEYALILALIAVVVIVAVTTLGKQVTNIFNGVSSQL